MFYYLEENFPQVSQDHMSINLLTVGDLYVVLTVFRPIFGHLGSHEILMSI